MENDKKLKFWHIIALRCDLQSCSLLKFGLINISNVKYEFIYINKLKQ